MLLLDSKARRWGATFEGTPLYYKTRMKDLASHIGPLSVLRNPPPRVISVFGPEGSGTKLLAGVIGTASGLFEKASSWRFERHAVWRDERIEVQHVSLPFGCAWHLNLELQFRAWLGSHSAS